MSACVESFDSPFGALQMGRYPESSNNSLRAWDAADEYLLEYLAEQELVGAASPLRSGKRVLVVNDMFGAVSCSLCNRQCQIFHWSDSVLSQLAVALNCQRNNFDAPPEFIKSTSSPVGEFDVVVIKVPKTIALLEDQLLRLRAQLHSKSIVVAAGMLRHLNRSAFQCFEKILGPVTTSLAKKKARLIFAIVDPALVPPVNPYPTSFTDSDAGFVLYGHANVFSRDRLDAGARYFLKQFHRLPHAQAVIDLGCGNGVLGIAYQRDNMSAEVCFVDESFMAIASAREGYQHQFSDDAQQARFVENDGLSGFADGCADLILCNPPFHQQHVVAEQLAYALFTESKRCLRHNGQLWVVANRHLPYQAVLKRLFGQCSVVTPGPRFNLYRAVKR